MFDFVGVLILLVLIALFGFLLTREWRINNAFLRWLALVPTGLLTLIFALVLVLALVGFAKLNANYNASHPVANIKVAGTPEQIKRGEKFVLLCAGCHSPTGKPPLVGQNFFADGPPLGTLYTANLTPVGEIKDWSDGEVMRAIREGVHKSGRSLIVMPAEHFRHLSDADVQALVAYLRSQPATGSPTPAPNLNVLGAVLMNVLPFLTVQEHISQPVTAPPEGVTAAYGKYLVDVSACRACHGENLTGGEPPPGGLGPPAGPKIVGVVGAWGQDAFVKALRTGVRPSGKSFGEEMPWKEFANLSDDDFKAIYLYISSLK